MARLSRRFRFPHSGHWPGPRSLVTTNGVSVDVLSSSYLDISVRWVCLPCGINQNGLGFPIRKSADQSLLTTPHSLSQRVTSFIASLYQGIHQMLFKTLDRTVHESSNRSDNHYYDIKIHLEKISIVQSVSWIALLQCYHIIWDHFHKLFQTDYQFKLMKLFS